MTIQEKAIEQLERISEHLSSIGEKEDYTDIAIKALEQARWIPVSERLPEEGQRVLITDKSKDVITAIYFQKSPFWKEMVLAWQPLPESYKAESEEQMTEHNPRITGRIEEWWKEVCQKHNCKYYIHEDYPKCSYCTCPDKCIVVDKSKAESE